MGDRGLEGAGSSSGSLLSLQGSEAAAIAASRAVSDASRDIEELGERLCRATGISSPISQFDVGNFDASPVSASSATVEGQWQRGTSARLRAQTQNSVSYQTGDRGFEGAGSSSSSLPSVEGSEAAAIAALRAMSDVSRDIEELGERLWRVPISPLEVGNFDSSEVQKKHRSSQNFLRRWRNSRKVELKPAKVRARVKRLSKFDRWVEARQAFDDWEEEYHNSEPPLWFLLDEKPDFYSNAAGCNLEPTGS